MQHCIIINVDLKPFIQITNCFFNILQKLIGCLDSTKSSVKSNESKSLSKIKNCNFVKQLNVV